jgi:catechol 2,3-dioxygenase-like lactoylglutathione lyase family enzyme
MGRALMIGGVFLISRDPGALAEWYRRHLGWELEYISDEDTYYLPLFFREDEQPKQRQNLVYSIMPGDPGEPGTGHIVNYRVDDIDSIVASLQAEGIETTPVITGDDGSGLGKFCRLQDPEGHRIELWQHLEPEA